MKPRQFDLRMVDENMANAARVMQSKARELSDLYDDCYGAAPHSCCRLCEKLGMTELLIRRAGRRPAIGFLRAPSIRSGARAFVRLSLYFRHTRNDVFELTRNASPFARAAAATPVCDSSASLHALSRQGWRLRCHTQRHAGRRWRLRSWRPV